MASGDYDEIVQLQSKQEINEGGNLTVGYVTVDSPWAKIISQRGQESLEAARQNARQTIRVKLRHRDDVRIDWRLVWDGQNWNIKYIDNSERRKGHLWLTCEVVGAK